MLRPSTVSKFVISIVAKLSKIRKSDCLRHLPMRQEQNETRHPHPFGLTAGYELIDDALRRVHEISKLSLPNHKGVRIRHGISKFKTWQYSICGGYKHQPKANLFRNAIRHKQMSKACVHNQSAVLLWCHFLTAENCPWHHTLMWINMHDRLQNRF